MRPLLLTLALAATALAGPRPMGAAPAAAARPVSAERMEAVYRELNTPFKFGPVLSGPGGSRVDNPRVFRLRDTWFMTYNHVEGAGGYEGWLATSDNLVDWRPVGKILAKGSGGWDNGSVGVYLGLQRLELDHAFEPQTFDGRFWMSYIGGRKDGFESYPLNIGLASTDDPTSGRPWARLPSNPILSVEDPNTGWWENRVQFASQLVHDPDRTLGYEYLIVYNAKGRRDNVERIGLAASRDLVHWARPLAEPLIANDPDYRISGDPQLLKHGDLFVLLYFRGAPSPADVGDAETFACSYDLVHWTKWNGTGLARAREPWEGRAPAHKPCVFRWNGTVYHFFNYTHVIDGRPYGGIGLSTSRYIGRSFQLEELEVDRATAGEVVVPGMDLAGYRGVLFRGRDRGDEIRFAFELVEAGDYDVQLALLAARGGGHITVRFDGEPIAEKLDTAASAPARREFELGRVKVSRPGRHTLTVTLDDALGAGATGLLLDSMDWRQR